MVRQSETPSASERGTQTGQVPDTGARIPSSPITASDLADQWEVHPDAWQEVSVKVQRPMQGRRTVELVGVYPLAEYSLSAIAAEFGPGNYVISGTGRHARNSASVWVSEEFARANHWSREPAQLPTPSGLMASRAFEHVAKGGQVGMDGFALVLERMMDNQARQMERLERLVLEKNAAPAVDPMAALAPALSLISAVQQNAFSMFSALAQGKVPEVAEDAKPWWADIAAAAIPAVADVAKAFSARRPGAAALPAQQPQAQALPALPAQQPQAQPAPNLEAPPMAAQIVHPSPLDAIPTAMLKQAAPSLAQAAANIPDDAVLADLIVNQIPPAMYPSLEKLNEAVKVSGPDALAFMGPEFVSERWPRVLALVMAEDEGGDDDFQID